MTNKIINVIAKESGDRIDTLLAYEIEGMTRNAAQRLIEQEKVTLDGKLIKKNHKCKAGETFCVEIPEMVETELVAQDIALDVVYEDEDIIVINKERGMVVHPAPGHESGTLVNALMYHCGDSLSGIGGERRPGIVHRIDKDTSGLLIVAKNDFAHQFLSAQLADRSLSREYYAVVHGSFREHSGVVDAEIGRHPQDRKRMAVTDKASRNAVTHWEIIDEYRGYSFIKCKLETGRTHQIRVHMAYIGHPIVGDLVYGKTKKAEKGLEGQCLHAGKLKFIHPRTNEKVELSAPLPEYFESVLGRLGEKV